MILTVALNAALDVTYGIAEPITPHRTHRVKTVATMPGGKALNTARLLATLQVPVLATGMVGGTTGSEIIERLPMTVRRSFTRVSGESRRTVVVADPVDATGLWEPGPVITAEEWVAFKQHYDALLAVSAVVVLSGSLPQGLPMDAYAQLINIAEKRHVHTILDCDSSSLRLALSARPGFIKPNLMELAEAVPHIDTSTEQGVIAASRFLCEAGAQTVVVSRGPDGLIAVNGDNVVAAHLPMSLVGNPTGAGDACVAALAKGVEYGDLWHVSLREAVALSAAAVIQPVAGTVAISDYLRFRRAVSVVERPA